MDPLKIGIVQQSCSDDREANVQKSIAGVRDAASRGAEVVILQELHTGLYFCQTEDERTFDLAEPIPGPSTQQFGEVAKELGVVIVLSLFERRAAGIYHNTAAVIERDGTLAGIYRKMHIPDDPNFYEKFYFTPGDLGFQPIETSAGRLGVLVCWDQWYPEAARLMALRGADMLIYPTAIGFHTSQDQQTTQKQIDAWMTVQRGHSVANALPVVAVNRVGFEPDPANDGEGLTFWGNSFVTGSQGELLARTSADREEVVVVELDRKKTEVVRRHWPFLRDRRIDAYEGIERRYLDSK